MKALGIVSPHAGLVYSGSVAGAVYSHIELPGTFVLIGPNHTGLGAGVSLMPKGAWETPLGRVEIDEELAAAIRVVRGLEEQQLAPLGGRSSPRSAELRHLLRSLLDDKQRHEDTEPRE